MSRNSRISILVLGILAGIWFLLKDSDLLRSQNTMANLRASTANGKTPEANPIKENDSVKIEVVTRQSDAEAKFKSSGDEVVKSIPTKKDLHRLTVQQVHYTPEVIQKAALGIARMAQMIADDPSLVAKGLEFYRLCAEKKDNPNSIRATCMANYEDLVKRYDRQEPSLENDPQVDDYIKKLFKKI